MSIKTMGVLFGVPALAGAFSAAAAGVALLPAAAIGAVTGLAAFGAFGAGAFGCAYLLGSHGYKVGLRQSHMQAVFTNLAVGAACALAAGAATEQALVGAVQNNHALVQKNSPAAP